MIVIILFIIFMITTAGVIGYIVFTSWMSWADKSITETAEDINDEIQHEVDAFMYVPRHINEVNRELIQSRIVDLNNEIERERYFVEILANHSDDVYSVSYGSETGEYYGARRNKNNVIDMYYLSNHLTNRFLFVFDTFYIVS